ncbi:MAG: hypothetical protein AAGA77_08550, partial [Bacteroidota bacterium]
MKKHLPLLLFVIIGFVACKPLKRFSTSEAENRYLYRQSIETAMSPAPGKICNDLVSIVPQNQDLVWKTIDREDYLLVVTWKNNVSYYKPYLDSTFYNTGDYSIWITTAPELLNRMKKDNPSDVDLRLKQLLGLPPNSVYNYFVEFWVRPSDLFRPCPDNEITDSRCGLCFSENEDASYIAWINDNRISRYYNCDLFDNYPWTQLGYTFDWNKDNKSHVGLSEFVI